MTVARESTTRDIETVESFRARARSWLAANLEPGPTLVNFHRSGEGFADELQFISHARELQRRIFDGGFAGICFPREYGGLGLTRDHQRAFNAEAVGYRFPTVLQIPTVLPCAAVLLDFGTEEQKTKHLPAILRGDEIWMQFLSEPGGGSDVAGAQTTAVRDGDEWVINGSKIWTTGAYYSDYALCLARTNWDAPKHRGLTVFIVKVHQPGIELHRIELANGSNEFCQEFISDVRVHDRDRIGAIDDGWTVGTRWMGHERAAMGDGSPYYSGPPFRTGTDADGVDPLLKLARAIGRSDDPVARDLLGEAHTLERARVALSRWIADGISAGVLSEPHAAISRLMSAVASVRRDTIALELVEGAAVAWAPDDPWARVGIDFIVRQSACIGGGTTEMARNGISERVLGMPREVTHDKSLPYREVPRGPTARHEPTGDR